MEVFYPGSDPCRLNHFRKIVNRKMSKNVMAEKCYVCGLYSCRNAAECFRWLLFEISSAPLAHSYWLPMAASLLSHSAGLWHVAEGLLVGHYLRRGDKHIALISSAIISSGQRGAEPTKAGRLASLLLTYLHCPTTHSLLISTVEIKLGVITKFLACQYTA